ncbi:MAG: glycoside hydrolase family 5 protein [Oscillospiraceae bacterium]|jgi:endoglucanase|nr:glycoside hydrolase family 5 protein [Oscillospiraceae bacterium]
MKTPLAALSLSLLLLFAACSPSSAPPSESPSPSPSLPSEPPHLPSSPSQYPPDVTQPFNDITAAEWVAAVRVGWNLGNTFDAWSQSVTPATTVRSMETMWGNPQTTRPLFVALYAEGFNAVRIPVTWFKACDEDYNIREDFLGRVKEVVGWALDAGMYVILNTHHDDKNIFNIYDTDDMEETKRVFGKLWEQIAANFSHFGERLIFEPMNEPNTANTPNMWNGGTPAERENINALNQLFVDTVRASGGHNDKRVLMVSCQSAHAHTFGIFSELRIPEDTAPNKIIVTIHEYVPYAFALSTASTAPSAWSADKAADTSPIHTPIDLAHNLFVSNGIPVVMGEMGAMNRDNTDARAAWAEYYIGYARGKGIPCFWWDNGQLGITSGDTETFGLIDRSNFNIVYPELVEAIMRGAGE